MEYKTMYPIRQSRNTWAKTFLKEHVCNPLCNTQYEINDNMIRLVYQTGCLFPEKLEPVFIHISASTEDVSTEFIDLQLEIPRTVKLVVEHALGNPFEHVHTFSEPEIYMSTVLRAFDSIYKRVYQEEEEQASKREFTVQKACPDCKESDYSEENLPQFFRPSTPEISNNCNICFEPGSEESQLVKLDLCQHQYHRDCILKWFNTSRPNEDNEPQKSNSCPMCRQPIIYCGTCKATMVVKEPFFGVVVPFSEDNLDDRIETDGPYRIHGLYYEELYFKGFVYDQMHNTLRLLPFERVDRTNINS